MSGWRSMLAGGVCLLLAAGLGCFLPGKRGVVFSGMAGWGSVVADLRTKVRDRDGLNRDERNVVEEYVRKGVRGMEVKEMRWVVDDFTALGLDAEYPEEQTAEGYLGLRKKREDWYLGALVSGLGLTKEQKRQAAEAMGVLRGRDYAVFVEYLEGLKSFVHEGKTMMIFDGSKARRLMDADYWMKDRGYAPGRLCDLDEHQMAVTWGSKVDILHVSGRSGAEMPGNGMPGWSFWKDAGGEPYIIADIHRDPRLRSLASIVSSAGVVFPLSKVQTERFQTEPANEGIPPIVARLMILQADQLKVLLLLSPEISRQLLEALEESGE